MINHHSLFIVEDNAVENNNSGKYEQHYNYNDLYFVVAEYLEKEYIVIYAAEDHFPDETIKNIEKITGIDAEAYVKEGTLTIIDCRNLYYYCLLQKNQERINDERTSNNSTSAQSLIKILRSEIEKKKNKERNNNNKILLVGTCKPFSERDDYNGLIAYENAINHELILPSSSSSAAAPTIECICCYRSSTARRIFSVPIMASVILNHDSTVAVYYNNTKNLMREKIDRSYLNHSKKHMKKLTKTKIIDIQPLYSNQKIIAAIKLGIDKTLGDNASNLILKTMKLVYYMDEYFIIQHPNVFVDTLVKLIGGGAANIILLNILTEMRHQIVDAYNR